MSENAKLTRGSIRGHLVSQTLPAIVGVAAVMSIGLVDAYFIGQLGADAVSSHIDDVRELSLSTGAAASQVLSSSTDLEKQASTLRTQMQAFLSKIRAA
jgi:methyl-accepting chemotaxis protein